jgi:hypothetical protein
MKTKKRKTNIIISKKEMKEMDEFFRIEEDLIPADRIYVETVNTRDHYIHESIKRNY